VGGGAVGDGLGVADGVGLGVGVRVTVAVAAASGSALDDIAGVGKATSAPPAVARMPFTAMANPTPARTAATATAAATAARLGVLVIPDHAALIRLTTSSLDDATDKSQ
jgi:hypothetical protein